MSGLEGRTGEAGQPGAMLEAVGLSIAYGNVDVLHDITLAFGGGEITAIIGPNGSGKSTLLRALARLTRPRHGRVRFRGRDVRETSAGEFARQVAFLPQSPEGPPDITIEELVWRGRYPHRGLLSAATTDDRDAVDRSLRHTGVDELRHRPLANLSGGERQRAWIAMSLAREPDVLLLDEPTNFLDLGHQSELLQLLRSLNAERGLTVLMVLHDVTQAAQHSHRVVGLRSGGVVLDGAPADVIAADSLSELFGTDVGVLHDPDTGAPVVVPRSRPAARSET